jgi:Tfp pilus assembly protein PilF
MTRAAALRALLLATSTFVPLAAFAQPAASPTAQSGTADAIRVLLDQATYWRGQYQDGKANEALSRVLVLDPNNADALAMQAQAAADDGQPAIAATALAKLKLARPDDPRIPGIAQALKMGPVDATALAEARAAAKAGKPADAVAAYRRAFKSDTPPAALATEYYQALADTDVDWSIPRAGLAAVLRANPQDLRAQLAYAELLTYHDDTRTEGIQRLGKLAQNPTIAERASKDLRQSLTWLPAIASSIPQYNIYLSLHPDDAVIAHLAETAKNDSAGSRLDGYEALQNDKLAEADAKFTEALKINPNDSDSMIGLGLVRMRQKKYADGAALIKQAIVLDPSKAEQYQALLDGGNINSTASATYNPAANAAFRRAQARY